MTAPKAQTLSQRFGFQDAELKTPKHDEIMLWLDENIKDILQSDNIMRLTRVIDLKGAEIVSVKPNWEIPVKNKDYIIGFVDMYASCEISYIDQRDGTRRTYTTGICFEVKSKIESLGELFRQLQMYKGLAIGNTYEHVIYICVICQDDRFENQIKNQGFGFIKYPGGEK